jgi:HD-GYP domain-containing protein (c-di-GMP phosphodiesterase class II)
MNLEKGMFVALLDRPWLETPFIMQGFEIREESEIGLLRKFCNHVYVDLKRSALPEKRIMAAHSIAGQQRDPFAGDAKSRMKRRQEVTLTQRLKRFMNRLMPFGRDADKPGARKVYRDSISTREEAPGAAHAYSMAVDMMNEVVQDLCDGQGIQVEKVKTAVNPLIDSVLRNKDAMAWLVTLRKQQEYAYHHSIATSVWALLLGRHLGFDRNGLQSLAMGGILLDVGKFAIPESITAKDGPLTDEEAEIMKAHVDYGVRLAKKTPGISEEVLEMIRSHHERHDGSGYPAGLAGEDISVYGRIAGLVDCYDAMISHRAWAGAKSSYDAVRELNLMAGKEFQREVVEQFVLAMGMFPTGTVVELNTGEIAIVVGQHQDHRLRPKIMMMLDDSKRPLGDNKIVDLTKVPSDETRRGARWIVQGHESGAFNLDPEAFFY